MGPEISSLCCGVRKDVLWKLTFLVKSVEILILWLKNCVYHSINHFAWFVVVVCDADHNISGFPELRFYSHIILSVSKVQKDLILSLFFFFYTEVIYWLVWNDFCYLHIFSAYVHDFMGWASLKFIWSSTIVCVI